MKKGILKIMLGSVILEAILVCLFILIGSFDNVVWKSLVSVGIIFVYSIPCLFYSKIYDNEEYKYIAISGASVVCVSALINILSLWNLIGESIFLSKIVGTFNVIMWMLVFISWILSYILVNNLLNLFKKISISLISLLSFFIIIILWTDSFPEGFLARFYYVLIVLTVGSFICTLILTRIYKKEILKASQNEENMETNSNISFVTQNGNTQQPNLQFVGNNQLQNQTSIPTQSVIDSTQTTNSIGNMQTNSNISFVTQNGSTQQPNLQSADNNQLQNQNLIPTQSAIDSTQTTNSIGNMQTNSLNGEITIDNNESGNNV